MLEAAPNGSQEKVTIGSFGGLEIQLILEKGDTIRGTLSLKGEYRTSRPLRGPGSDRLLAYLHELAESLPAIKQEAAENKPIRNPDRRPANPLGLPFAHEAKLAQLTALRGELQALLQSNTPTQQIEDAAEPPSVDDQAAATATLAKEAVQERTAVIVRAFDALMKGNPPSSETHVGAPPGKPSARAGRTIRPPSLG